MSNPAAHAPTPATLKQTPLHALHVALGARLVPFAGYEMPVQYPDGILREHLHTREKAGLFDVSHMGQIELRAKSGDIGDAARALETLVPADIAGLAKDRQRYTLFTNGAGGIRDDLMVAKRASHLLLIVNAACKEADEAHLRAHLSDACEITVLDRALIALQGPKAEDALATFAPECRVMRFMDVRDLTLFGATCVAVRSGYTGEDGFEISLPADHAIEICQALLACDGVAPVGLGARDSLRLEAGLPLYGADLNETTTPVEAGLAWSIPKIRRTGGARAGGFPGAEHILHQLASGPLRVRVGLLPEGRQPVREGALVYASAQGGDVIGSVTSGGFGPSAAAPVSMAFVPKDTSEPGTVLFAEVRGKRIPVKVTPMPFIPHTYKRS